MSMTNSTNRVEIITSVQRRRRWTAPEKVRMVEETFEPGMTVSLVARRHGVAPNQLFTWRRLVAQGSLTAAGSGEEVVPASAPKCARNTDSPPCSRPVPTEKIRLWLPAPHTGEIRPRNRSTSNT